MRALSAAYSVLDWVILGELQIDFHSSLPDNTYYRMNEGEVK